MGRTECNRVVNFEGDARLVGQMVDVRITRSLAYTLRGEVPTAESRRHRPRSRGAGGLMAKLKSARGSFQQLLLFAFLLITALLVGVALRSVFQYDALMTQSRDAAARALHALGRGAVAGRAQRRPWSARGASRWCSTTRCCARRFDDAARDAHQVLDRLGDNGLPPAGLDAVARPAGRDRGPDERRARHRARAREHRWRCSSATSTRSTPTSRSRPSS